ncbi:unnamed protein product [Notodromas monacha]|uniref:ethanolamine kinase n=1 Tax=Notodromas monacha TaxID=399045 RepID=A0A7R9BDQ8_9CRUS|nr:unnamed protein product [Notodromas monacha]CAG0912915.1 unnamed protein product [Notodromas monacha]
MKFPLELDIEIKRDSVLDGALAVVNAVRPNWDPARIQHKEFTAGITNRLFAFSLEKNGDTVLVRIYGDKTDGFIDRKKEKENMRVFPLVCDQMAKIHSIPVTDALPSIWRSLDKMCKIFPSSLTPCDQNDRFLAEFPGMSELLVRIDFLKRELESAPQSVALCHNDALLENIVLSCDRKSVTFIDYEYAGTNVTAYDIANHFNEWAGVEEVDYSLYPSREEQTEWIRRYLMSTKKYQGVKCLTVSDAEVDDMISWVNKFSAASHLFWAVWAIIQASSSDIDFDFLGYAITRYNEYKKQLEKNFRNVMYIVKRLFAKLAADSKQKRVQVFELPKELLTKAKKLTKKDYVVNADGFVECHTDGACSLNGKLGASGGIGVWFGPLHPLNVSIPLTKGRQTSNRAEIMAVVHAVEIVKASGCDKLEVKIDSHFTINCVEKWIQKWKLNGWKTTSGENVKNREELELLDSVSTIPVRYVYVPGHKGNVGNMEADKFAKSGAKYPVQEVKV